MTKVIRWLIRPYISRKREKLMRKLVDLNRQQKRAFKMLDPVAMRAIWKELKAAREKFKRNEKMLDT